MGQNYQQGCLHCPGGLGLKYPLFDDDCFWIVCDVHPLVKGHILIITKKHIPCMGALDGNSFRRFKELYKKVSDFLNKNYGQIAIFEHGISGQTVPHAHTHLFPFGKSIKNIVPEKELMQAISTLDEINAEFNKNNKYLYVAINNNKWLVDTKIAYPRFFRDRFSKALSAEERGDYKKTESNPELMEVFDQEIQQLKNKWNLFFNE